MKFLSYDAYVLKWIAVIAMIANHVAIAWHTILPFWALLPLYAVGGITYTIMAFFIVEGYRHTSNLKKYFSRLLIFGLIAQAFHPMVLGPTALFGGIFLNILFTIILALFTLLMYDKIKIRFLFWLLFILVCAVSLFMDLFFVGILMPVMYYAIKKEGVRRTLPGIVAGIIFSLISALPLLGYWALSNAPGMEQEAYNFIYNSGFTLEFFKVMPFFGLGNFVGAILIRNFNGERGKRSKWLFYVAYPTHLAVIAGISLALGLTAFSLFGF